MTTSQWEIGPRFHVFPIFMVQFIILIMGGGIVVPELHKQGVNTVVLVLGTAAASEIHFRGDRVTVSGSAPLR